MRLIMCIVILKLLRDETCVIRAMALLYGAHFKIKAIYDHVSPVIRTRSSMCFEPLVVAGKVYFQKALIASILALNLTAIILTHVLKNLILHAPCILCKAVMWYKIGAAAAAKWMAGDA